jgi:hypothetical protein
LLETQTPPKPVYRIARKPNAWQSPDWSRAHQDGTFGNRFDDPDSFYRVLYASSQELSCFIETLARFRTDLTLVAELAEIRGEDDFLEYGVVPSEWRANRVVGTAVVRGHYADICAPEWIGHLRKKLAVDCHRLGIADLDACVLQSADLRSLTQLVSRCVYEAGLPGIYYRSRHGHSLENWAFFEPFHISDPKSKRITADNPALQEALTILNLTLAE